MTRRFVCTLALMFLSAVPAHAEDKLTIEQQVPRDVLLDKRTNILSVVLENDLFAANGRDDNYTSGMRISYIDIGSSVPGAARWIDRIVPTFRVKPTTAVYYSLGQNIYTPHNIERTTVDPNDRPWAAFLYGSMGMVTLTDNHMDEVEATLGVVGPLALGEPTQKFIHKHISDSAEPRGWSHQLKNEPGLMLAWQRSFPMYVHGDIGTNFWSFKPYLGATIGNVRTYADVGFSLRLSPADSKWQDTPVRVRPAMPGTGIYEIPKDGWSWALFGGMELRAVARDIFLDGNTFADSYSIDKKPLVADGTLGAALTYKQFRVSYTMVYRTKEFQRQEDPEVFGAVSASIRF